MNKLFPRAEDLTHEEIDYEFVIRQQPEEVFKLELSGKQRHLRSLFKDDQKEGRNYRSQFSIMDEAAHIEGRISNLEKALEKRVEAKFESRVIHYWYRTKRSVATNDEEKKIRRELVRKIENVMRNFQFGPPMSPYKNQINNIIQGEEGAVGGVVEDPSRVEQNTEEGQVDGVQQGTNTPLPASPQNLIDRPLEAQGSQPLVQPLGGIPMNPTSWSVSYKFPEPQDQTGDLGRPNTANTGQRYDQFYEESDDSQNGSDWRTSFRRVMGAIPKGTRELGYGQQQSEIVVSRQEWNDMKMMMNNLMSRLSSNNQGTGTRTPCGGNRTGDMPARDSGRRSTGRQQAANQNNGQGTGIHDFTESDEDERDRRPRVPRVTGRQNPSDEDVDDSIDEVPRRRYRDRQLGFNRVEKWKLRFTGESRSMPIENFLYKAKKLAEREGVTKEILLRDIHMLLEGAAADWFFTFVDDFRTWEIFETDIIYRFGNPNKDQGIRTKIQERKQQRGESFIAFLTEIEKLNKMLSRPLSQRRKFEVIWDNMRQHYRSKISIVEVKDLQHLTRLNYRIDAADPHLQPQTTEYPQRRPVNQIDAEGTDYDSDHSIPVNAIRGQFNRDSRQNNGQGDQSQRRSSQTQQAGTGNPTAAPSRSCWNCQSQGHGWRQCTRPKLVFCYGCGNLGRTTRNCERCARSHGTEAAGQQGNE